ncbi:hypothetical protein CCC_04096 [Paramagnetospirillum magnetotacticum MS-1]|uniref:Uncharacterized protein n=1 Tax=Paramagnetospirillum magnetotacticum MS-1 TaxID=272627 RepID=A0A0C2YY40_PARME|nr:hypothetical protein [Paramagnetospirillum magnetotacticum]KIL99580.1 hypothetical protein CCC_04096 [Paramagnetospirillum magnetotacticum MS-1]
MRLSIAAILIGAAFTMAATASTASSQGETASSPPISVSHPISAAPSAPIVVRRTTTAAPLPAGTYSLEAKIRLRKENSSGIKMLPAFDVAEPAIPAEGGWQRSGALFTWNPTQAPIALEIPLRLNPKASLADLSSAAALIVRTSNASPGNAIFLSMQVTMERADGSILVLSTPGATGNVRHLSPMARPPQPRGIGYIVGRILNRPFDEDWRFLPHPDGLTVMQRRFSEPVEPKSLEYIDIGCQGGNCAVNLRVRSDTGESRIVSFADLSPSERIEEGNRVTRLAVGQTVRGLMPGRHVTLDEIIAYVPGKPEEAIPLRRLTRLDLIGIEAAGDVFILPVNAQKGNNGAHTLTIPLGKPLSAVLGDLNGLRLVDARIIATPEDRHRIAGLRIEEISFTKPMIRTAVPDLSAPCRQWTEIWGGAFDEQRPGWAKCPNILAFEEGTSVPPQFRHGLLDIAPEGMTILAAKHAAYGPAPNGRPHSVKVLFTKDEAVLRVAVNEPRDSQMRRRRVDIRLHTSTGGSVTLRAERNGVTSPPLREITLAPGEAEIWSEIGGGERAVLELRPAGRPSGTPEGTIATDFSIQPMTDGAPRVDRAGRDLSATTEPACRQWSDGTLCYSSSAKPAFEYRQRRNLTLPPNAYFFLSGPDPWGRTTELTLIDAAGKVRHIPVRMNQPLPLGDKGDIRELRLRFDGGLPDFRHWAIFTTQDTDDLSLPSVLLPSSEWVPLVPEQPMTAAEIPAALAGNAVEALVPTGGLPARAETVWRTPIGNGLPPSLIRARIDILAGRLPPYPKVRLQARLVGADWERTVPIPFDDGQSTSVLPLVSWLEREPPRPGTRSLSFIEWRLVVEQSREVPTAPATVQISAEAFRSGLQRLDSKLSQTPLLQVNGKPLSAQGFSLPATLNPGEDEITAQFGLVYLPVGGEELVSVLDNPHIVVSDIRLATDLALKIPPGIAPPALKSTSPLPWVASMIAAAAIIWWRRLALGRILLRIGSPPHLGIAFPKSLWRRITAVPRRIWVISAILSSLGLLLLSLFQPPLVTDGILPTVSRLAAATAWMLAYRPRARRLSDSDPGSTAVHHALWGVMLSLAAAILLIAFARPAAANQVAAIAYYLIIAALVAAWRSDRKKNSQGEDVSVTNQQC